MYHGVAELLFAKGFIFMTREKILVTSALPYANGPIHFGHIAGAYLPADIFVRHKRMCGADIIYICGTDDHGVAITISAKLAGVTPQEHVAKNHKVIKDIFDKINIEFDNFSGTSHPIHHGVAQEFFQDVLKAGYIVERVTKQLYCEHDKMFLADRYITGTCPHCGFVGARGDECGGCGKWLDPLEITEPRCKVCGAEPIAKDTKNWFLQLDKLQPKIEKWLESKEHWKDNVLNFVKAWMEKGLEERAISRDMTWGIKLPVEGVDGKVLYVWFDAPIGYISSTMEWAQAQGEPERWRDYWQSPDTRLIHFIGKDNIPFHCIVFPATIIAKNEVNDEQYTLVENVPSNEFYNLEGRQFSKSDGWYIDLEDFFSKYSVDSIRYTLCANMPEKKDAEFTWKDFGARNNSELADTFGNLAQRMLKFADKHFASSIPPLVSPDDEDNAMIDLAKSLPDRMAENLDAFEFRKALFEWMELAREGNKYFDKKAPWKTVKTDKDECGNTMHVIGCIMQSMAVTGFPFLPDTARKLWSMLGFAGQVEEQNWFEAPKKDLAAGQKLGVAEILFEKIPAKKIDVEVEKLKEWAAQATLNDNQAGADEPKEYAPLKTQVTFDDFMKLDFRVATIIEAEAVPKSKKLVKLQIDLGFEKRQIVAGILKKFTPEQLVGRTIIVVANLAPAKLMGVESSGMLLAAHDGDRIVLLTTDAAPGSAIS